MICQKKIRNKNYKKLGIEPLEVAIRSEIGYVINPLNIKNLDNYVKSIIDKQHLSATKKEMISIRKKYLFEKQNNEYLLKQLYN